MKTIPVWIDTDPGVDDAAALLLAARLAELNVVGLSATAGNVELAHTYPNTRDLAAFTGLAAPVHKGAAAPLIRDAHYAKEIHGENGLQGQTLPPSSAPWEGLLAWDALYKAACRCNGELVLVPIGPLTNVATALLKYPDLKERIARIVLMGGAVRGGNTTPAAEFNIFFDPDAADLVFRSGIPLTMLGLDVTRKARLTPSDLQALREQAGAPGLFLADCLERTLDRAGAEAVTLHDPTTLLYLVEPQLFTVKQAGVRIETKGPRTRGKTVCDLYSDFHFPERKVDVVIDLDPPRFRELFLQRLVYWPVKGQARP